MNQISKQADTKLNAASRTIGKAEKDIETATAEKDKAWVDVLDTISEFDAETRFLADDGYALQRQERQGTPKRNDSQLSQRLRAISPSPQAFNALWNAITVRVVDSTLLEKAVQQGKIQMEDVSACMTIPEPTFARIRREWTKDDKQKAAILGITVKE